MNKQMDVKLKKLQSEKQAQKQSTLVQQVQNLKEKHTDLILKSRQLGEEDVEIVAGSREFVAIENIEQQVVEGAQKVRAYFTIGVVVESSKEMTTKNGKKYKVVKISDLVKYDTLKVKRHLE